MGKKKRTVSGEVTVFLSLAFVLLVSFVLGILEAATLQTSKNLARLSADRAIYSVFGEYNSLLMEKFHVFGLEAGYGTGSYDEDNLTARMHYYGTEDMDYEITAIQFLTDNSGQAFREQVLAYMEQIGGASLLESLLGLSETREDMEITESSIEETLETQEEAEEELSSILSDMAQAQSSTADSSAAESDSSESGTSDDSAADSDSSGSGTSDDSASEGSSSGGGTSGDSAADSDSSESETVTAELDDDAQTILGFLDTLDNAGILSLVMPEGTSVSSKAVSLDDQVSGRELETGRGTFSMRSGVTGTEENLLFHAYILDHFSTMVSAQEDTQDSTEEGTAKTLDYEVEYILAGKKSDRANLESVVTQIFLLRTAQNFAYLQTDSQRKAKAETFAATVCAVLDLLGVPVSETVLKQLVLVVWASAESIAELRTLLSGGKIPAAKDSDSWQVSLTAIPSLLNNSSVMAESTEEDDGLSYAEYLQMLLLLRDADKVTMRTLDRVEEDMQSVYGETNFRADWCVSAVAMTNTLSLYGNVTYTFPLSFGYE